VALWRLYAKGDLAADYRAVKPLNLFALPPTTVHSTKPVRTIADFRGMKIIVLNKNMGQIVTVMGGTPISLTAGESYQALDRGVADAVGMAWAGVTTFKIAEVAKHHLDVPLGAAPAMFFMNKESYARLPEKARRAIDTTSGEKLSRSVGQAADESDEDGRGKTKAMSGQTVGALDPKDAPEWRERLKPVAEQWARTAPDGAKVLAAFRAEIAAIRAGR
jgi:TRAP-type C4-dicarboxylate transport system substrate-binding protein